MGSIFGPFVMLSKFVSRNPGLKSRGFVMGWVMEKKRCEICNKQRPINQFTKTDTTQVCVKCKQAAIIEAKRALKEDKK